MVGQRFRRDVAVFFGPALFAINVGRSSETRPYVMLAKMSAGFVVVAASMVGATYSLSSLFGLSAYRFTVEGGGVIGEGIAPLQRFILLPLGSLGLTALIGLAAAVVTGPVVLWMFRRDGRYPLAASIPKTG